MLVEPHSLGAGSTARFANPRRLTAISYVIDHVLYRAAISNVVDQCIISIFSP